MPGNSFTLARCLLKTATSALLLGLWAGNAEAAEPPTQEDALVSSSFRLHGTLAGARALSGYQNTELDFGGAAYGAVSWGTGPKWGLQLEAGWLGLTASDATPPAGVAPLEGEDGVQLGLGVRVRPFAPPSGVISPAGLWLSAAGGMSITGGRVAPQLDAFLGYDFYARNNLAFGPTVGYAHIFSVSEAPRSDDASVLLFGVHVMFDFVQHREMVPPPPPDQDGDGILDRDDACHLEAEDFDDFEDADGCPDTDNDQDGLVDIRDECPNDAEDEDGFEDEDGCPDPDNDDDGVVDGQDECPELAEDEDGFEDEDGCPDTDNDGDGLPDDRDLCSNEPETFNGYSDNDGCPDTKSVRVVGDKIELDQRIHFWSDSAKIRGMSYPVLDKLAGFLKEHPEYTRIAVEGHADSRGPEELNMKISGLRAESVRAFLIKRGLAADRISAEGFGETRPLVEAETERAWFMNRRVEFIVTRERTETVTSDHGEAQSDTQQDADPGDTSTEEGATDDETTTPDAKSGGGGVDADTSDQPTTKDQEVSP